MRKVFPSLLSLLLAFVARPTAASGLFPDALTKNGQDIQRLLTIVTALGAVVFLIVFVWLVVVIVRFREGSGHGRATHEKERHSLKAELTWTFVPLVMVLWIGYAAYGALVQIDHGIDPKDVKVDILVTGSQWTWAADYGNAAGTHCPAAPASCEPVGAVVIQSNPGHLGEVAAANTFYVPADVPIHFNITSSDVIHAWQVIDSNRAYVMFVDANPLGANKYNSQTVSLPAGDYFVQCNKMCLNPGHAYMHAVIKSVPGGVYQSWLSHQRALVKPAGYIVSEAKVDITQEGFSLGNQTLASKTHFVLDVTNPTEQVITFSLDGKPSTAQVPAHGAAFVTFDIASSGAHELTASNGAHASITAVEAIPKEVDLAAFRLEPDHLDLQVGQTYLITVKNVHSLPHNLNVGHYPNALWNATSTTITGGGVDAFLVKPTEKGQFDMWCAVAGHYASGMKGTVTVS